MSNKEIKTNEGSLSIGILCPSIYCGDGGLQNLAVMLANKLLSRNHKVTVIYLDIGHDEYKRTASLDSRIKTIAWNHDEKEEILRLSGIDVIINYIYDSSIWQYLEVFTRLEIPYIYTEHNSPDDLEVGLFIDGVEISPPAYKLGHEERMMVFALANWAQVYFNTYKNTIDSNLHYKVSLVGNPIKIPSVIATPSEPNEKGRYKIISFGRLAPHKNHVLLIEAFAKIATQYPQWDLDIWGNDAGSQEMLLEVIQQKNIGKQVFLKGYTLEMQRCLLESNIYVMPSYNEGFPLALSDAMAIGLPVIAVAKCLAANQLIQNTKSGMLTPDFDADLMAKDLTLLMDDAQKRVEIGVAARESMKQYSEKIFIESYEDMCVKAIKNKKEKLEYNKDEYCIKYFRSLDTIRLITCDLEKVRDELKKVKDNRWYWFSQLEKREKILIILRFILKKILFIRQK